VRWENLRREQLHNPEREDEDHDRIQVVDEAEEMELEATVVDTQGEECSGRGEQERGQSLWFWWFEQHESQRQETMPMNDWKEKTPSCRTVHGWRRQDRHDIAPLPSQRQSARWREIHAPDAHANSLGDGEFLLPMQKGVKSS